VKKTVLIIVGLVLLVGLIVALVLIPL